MPELPDPPRYERLVHDTLLRAAARFPEKTALVAADERVTFRELALRARRLARALQDRGVRRGDRVALYLENGVPVVEGMYAASMAGAAFMVINPQTKADKLAYVLNDSGARALITDGRLARSLRDVVPQAPELATVVQHGKLRDDVPNSVAYDELVAGADAGPRETGAIANDLAALIYTSGSTGNPKGVMLSHRNVTFTQGSLVEYLRLSDEDRILNVLPLAFDYGLYQVLMGFHAGATVVLETSFGFPQHIVRRVREEEVTVFPGVPTVFATLLSLHRKEPLSLPSVRRITNTAQHLPDEYVPALLEMAPEALIFKMYGLTECKRVSYLEPELVLEKPSSVGRAIPGTEAFVLGDDGEPVAPGEIGTLHVRGPHVMMGYWNLPEATAEMLVPGPYPGERMLNTHDLFKTDEEGFLYFVGRSDDIIKSRGEKVSPVEVENALAAIPGVREVAILGVEDEVMGQAIRAFVVLDEGVDMNERAFKREAMARLENYMVPRDVVFMDDLPKTGSGKVRKKSLVESA